MKKGYISRLAAVLLVFILILLVITGEKLDAKISGKLMGTVIEINMAEKIIVVQGKHSGMTFEAASARLVGYKSFQSIKEGDAVSVSYVMEEGKATASVISRASRPAKQRRP